MLKKITLVFGHFLMQEALDELNRSMIETVANMTGGSPQAQHRARQYAL